MEPRPIDGIRGYHAHIYYTDTTRPHAAALRATIERTFEVRMGRLHDQPVGPHLRAMYQVAFDVARFSEFVPWLMLNRGGLTVLVHPETGDDLADHTAHALWLGETLGVNEAFLSSLAARPPTDSA